jgi:drug/metabolite transporter (DMT)-like permease
MIGPISTITLGVLLLGEHFNAWMAAGTLLVLAGVTLLARAQSAAAARVASPAATPLPVTPPAIDTAHQGR